jgi:sugar lactone lactonase YvrE/enterochelin esterase-like enzyme
MGSTLVVLPAIAADDYRPGPDSLPQEGVPKGERIEGQFENSSIFPGTRRKYTLYIPQQLKREKAAPLMVFQDRVQYQATVVFDNLIARGDIPALLGVFVSPGVVPALNAESLDRYNRSLEYDGLGDDLARMLSKELLPELEKRHGIKFSRDPNLRAIAGASSGGIAAFTAAWERPDYFRRVFTSVGTYVGLRGGHEYPVLVRKCEPKPLRIFLQDGSADLDGYSGNWYLANQEMLSALQFSGYEVNHQWGEGGHNGKHATAIFPEALKWLWKDHDKALVANPQQTSKAYVHQLIPPGADWELVSEGHRFTEGPTANAAGEVFYTDIPNNRIHRISRDGKVSVFAQDTQGANGLMFGPDGRLYACANKAKQIHAYTTTGERSVVAEGLGSNDLCITHSGNLYATDPEQQQVWLVKPDGSKQVVDKGINFPNGILLSPDQSLLYVADMQGQFVWSYQIQPDGSLKHKQHYFHLHRLTDRDSKADGMTVDTSGNLYVTTELGVQICDQAGRVKAILHRPQYRQLANICFGGIDLSELYVTCSDKVYKRKSKMKGVLSGLNAPIKPEKPKL